MKSNRKFRDDDSGVATVVSTILLIAIIVPMMTMIMMTFATMTQKQMEMMDTTVSIMDQFISQIKDRNGYNVTTGVGVLNKTSYTIRNGDNEYIYPCYVILYKMDNPYSDGRNISAFYPVETLPQDFINDIEDGKNVNVSFRVRSITTYFRDYIPSSINVNINGVVKKVDVSLVEIIDISRRLGRSLDITQI